MVLNKHEVRFKRYIRLTLLESKNSNEQYKQPLIIIESYQRGWEMYIILSESAKNRADYPEMSELVKAYSSTYITTDVNEIRTARKFRSWEHYKTAALGLAKGRAHRNRVNYPILEEIKPEVWEKLDPKYQKHFYKTRKTCWWRDKEEVRYQLHIPESYLVVKVKPYMIGYRREIDPILLQEEKEIDSRLRELRYTGYAGDKWRNLSKTHPKGSQRTAYRSYVAKFLKGELEDIPVYDEKDIYYY